MAHRKFKRKFLNILLIPDDESSPRSLKIRYSYLTALLILLIFLMFGLLIGGFTYGQLLQKAYENISLVQENEKLKGQLQRIYDLTDEVEKLKAYNRKVRNSMTGYIDLSGKLSEVEKINERVVLPERAMISMLATVPLKAPVLGFISQEYKPQLHNGIDIVAPEGTPVVAAGQGVVLYSGWSLDGGNTIILGHPGGYYSYYKHNMRNLVFENQEVMQGDLIAYLGNSGQKSYGPHLHFEIWKDGFPLDPRNLIMEFE